MTRVLGLLLVAGSIATAALYAGIMRRLDAERAPGSPAADAAQVAVAALPDPGGRPEKVVVAAPAPPLDARRPARVDGTLATRAIALAERLAVPKVIHGVFAYVVEPGDWVEEISRRFGVPLDLILNVHGLGRDAVLHPGDVFCLPIIEYTERVGLASWYGPGFDHRQGANGAVYHEDQVSAAALHYPFDLRLEIERRDNRKRVFVQVVDRGPYFDGRIVDLSRGAARALESVQAGVVEVVVKPVNAHLAAIDRYLGRSLVARSRA